LLFLAAVATASERASAATCPCTLLPVMLTPEQTGVSTANGRPGGPWTLELGVRFQVDTPVRLSALSFYKDSVEAGAHVGNLWTLDGVRLATVPFGAESASGWQVQGLPTPVELAAGTTYVASVGLNSSFVQTLGGLSTAFDSGPLHSLVGANGVYADAAGLFPTQTFNTSNYFVDVEVLDDGVPAAPTLATVAPANGAIGVDPAIAPSAVVTRSLDATTVTPANVTLERSDGTPVAAAVAYDAGAGRVTLTPSATLATSTTFVARMSTEVRSADGVPLPAPVSWSFTTREASPTAVTRTPAPGASAVPINTTVTVTFSRDMDPTTLTTSSFTLVNGSGIPAVVTYDGPTRTATLTPTVPLVGGKVYTARVSTAATAADGVPLAADVVWSFTAACPCMLLPLSLSPASTGLSTANGRAGGPWSRERGVKFTVDAPTRLSALAFYKDAAETGAHVGRLWSGDGTLLATVAFGTETASGWQEQPFATPVTLAPGTTYVASVGVNSTFVQTLGGYSAPVDSGRLHAVIDGQNGVFGDAAGTFPTQSFLSSNYFVDVEVMDDGTPAAPTLAATNPANGATNVLVGAPITATATRALDPATVNAANVTVRRVDGVQMPAAVAYDASAKRITITPSSLLDSLTPFTATISAAVKSSDGVPFAGAVSWTFTTGNGPPSVFSKAPAAGATGVPTNSSVSVVFSRDMDTASITATTFNVTESNGTVVPGSIAYDAAARKATFTPAALLLTSMTYTVRIDGSARAADGVPFFNAISWSFSTPLGTLVRLNSGDGAYTARSGAVYAADASFTGGTAFTTGNSITRTDDPRLYQSERYGDFRYAIPVANGVYDVRLHFVELYFGTTVPGCEGKRLFSLDVGDTPASPDIANLDICSEVGPTAAMQRLIRNVVVRDGALDLTTIRGIADDPELAAVEVLPAGTPLGDIDAPTAPTSLTAAGGVSQASLGWQAATDNVGVTVYDVYRGTTPGFNPTYSTRIAQTTQTTYLDALKSFPAGTYYYVVRAEDDVGNRGPVSNQASAIVVADTTPPTVPGSLVATAGVAQASLSWTASTDLYGPVKYDVFRGTTSGFVPVTANRVARIATTTYVDKPLAAGTYYYVVRAFDGAGNTSASSNEAVAVVTADTTAPTVSLTAPAANATVAGVVSASATASDNVGVAGVTFQIDGITVGAEDTTSPYSVPWDTTTSTNGVHVVTAVARDAAGNTTTSGSRSVTVSNAAPPTGGLVGAWAFADGVGTTAADSSGSGNTGTLENATFGTGHSDGGIALNGTNARVTVADANSLDVKTGLTLEAWVKPAALGSVYRTVLLKERGTTGLAYALYASSDTGKPVLQLWTGVDSTLSGPAALPVNAWSHLAGTYDGAMLRLYVNGTLVATKAASGSIAVTANPLRFGGNAIWGEWFSGALDDLRVYNRALTGGEIATDMSTPVG
jgi:hypothetical protein